MAGVRGYDAGKKIKDSKCHIIIDTNGHLVYAIVHAAEIQDRDNAPLVLGDIRSSFSALRHVFADGGYASGKHKQALTKRSIGLVLWLILGLACGAQAPMFDGFA